MLSIKVLGPGCMNCERVYEVTKSALQSAGVVDATIVKVTDRTEYPKVRVAVYPGPGDQRQAGLWRAHPKPARSCHLDHECPGGRIMILAKTASDWLK